MMPLLLVLTVPPLLMVNVPMPSLPTYNCELVKLEPAPSTVAVPLLVL